MYITADAAWGKLSGGALSGNTDGRVLVQSKRLQTTMENATRSRSVCPVKGCSFKYDLT